MAEVSSPLASGFLLLTAGFFLCVYALPLLVAPLRWARWFGWRVPPGEPHLTVYLGRCLGAVALCVIGMIGHAAVAPVMHLPVFLLIAAIGALMTLVHVDGAVRRRQPPLETAEIALYAGVTALSLWMWTTLQHAT